MIYLNSDYMINKKLKKYLKKQILPKYILNDEGHNIKHINYVIKRSIKFSKTVSNIDKNIVYTVASYHDLGYYKDPKNHEKIAAEIFKNDNNIKTFFTEEEINLIIEAIEDHRASKGGEPRNIYGKIIASADKNVSVDDIIKRTYIYIIKYDGVDKNNFEFIFNKIKEHIKEKYGKKGYATNNMYFKDKKYDKYLKKINNLLDNEKKLEKNIKKLIKKTKGF